MEIYFYDETRWWVHMLWASSITLLWWALELRTRRHHSNIEDSK